MAKQRHSAGLAGLWALSLFLLACLFPSAVLAGDFHRWVDDDGNVYYTDAPPPDSVRTGKPRPGESAGARDDGASAEAEANAARAEQDHVLLQSYSTVEEIRRTRDRRLDGVEGEIGLAEYRVRQAQQRLEKYDSLLGDLPADSEHRQEMQAQRAEARARLERREQDLQELEEKGERMRERFAEDIERFRELTGEADAGPQ